MTNVEQNTDNVAVKEAAVTAELAVDLNNANPKLTDEEFEKLLASGEDFVQEDVNDGVVLN